MARYSSPDSLSDLSGQDIIDSRDIVSRFEELRDERESLESDVEEKEEAATDAADAVTDTGDEDAAQDARTAAEDARKALKEWDEENAEELEALKAICEEGSGQCSDWEHGETLIREDYFTEYAEELVKEIGDMPREIPSYIEIDWEATADNLKADYSTIEIDGTTYYHRSY